MDLQPRLKARLEAVRKASESWLTAFQTPEQWMFQVAPGVNHALWFVGHMAVVDNMMLRILSPADHRSQPDLEAKYGVKSTPSASLADNVPPTELLEIMRERRQTFLAVLDRMSEADLSKPVPSGSPPMFSDLASMFELSIWHEGLHAGQMTVARRALGYSPIFA